MKAFNIKGKLFITIFISFILLYFSLYMSFQGISSTSKMIDFIEKNQLQIAKFASELEEEIKVNQSFVMQTIIMQDMQSLQNIHSLDNEELMFSCNKLNSIVEKLNTITFEPKTKEIVKVIKHRVVAFKIVEDSLIKAIETKDKEDIEDALIGFNTTATMFSNDISNLIKLSNSTLHEKILDLKNSNKESKRDIFYSFLMALVLISFSMYKLFHLHNQVQVELKRAEVAEKEQKKLREKLKKYTQDLEQEVTNKTLELHKNIYTNFLSGLPNRNQLLEDASNEHFKYMALLNIDKFQKFNDVYGEEMGNNALKISAEYLNNQFQEEDIAFYHIGGDEFVYAIKDSNELNKTYFIEKIKEIIKKYQKENFVYNDIKFNFMISAGISFSGNDKMLAYTDMALKNAKSKNIPLSIFDEDKELEQVHKDDIECYKKLSHALKTDKVVSYFQPIVSLQDETKKTKYESLVRLELEDGKVIPPYNFLRVAKLNRVYYKITRAVVKNTLAAIEKYKISCSINLSLTDIKNERTMEMLFKLIDEFEYNYLITFELLETEEITDYNIVYDFCIKARTYGIKIALDDFGSGYSNFSHVIHLPVNYIKIDASLISNVDRDVNSQIMVETIVGLAKKLHVQTIAEFVSSKEIYETVKRLNVDFAQGYYIGKPEPIEHLLKNGE